jgi:Bacterial extracellular solute-binding protein
MGLTVPKTWAQLLSVTKKIQAAGKTPWALGAKDSWTLTDWFENIYIRTAGPAKYNRLFAGKLRFDHPSVISALRRMTTILNDRYVVGGIQRAIGVDFYIGIGDVFRSEYHPAHLIMEGGFVGGIALDYNPRLKPGKTIDEAPFPTVDPSFGSPLIGGATLTAVFVDNAQVRELLRYLTSPAAARIWVSTGETVSTNKRVPLSAYPNHLARAEAKQVAGAKVFRFDGSDLLPGSLAGSWGSTLQKVIGNPEGIPNLMKDFQRKAAREFKKWPRAHRVLKQGNAQLAGGEKETLDHGDSATGHKHDRVSAAGRDTIKSGAHENAFFAGDLFRQSDSGEWVRAANVCARDQRIPSAETTKDPVLQVVRKTGATGLEPATSGVTGRSWR